MRKKLYIKENFLKLWGRLTSNVIYGDPEKYIGSSSSFYNSTLKYILLPSVVILLIRIVLMGLCLGDGSTRQFAVIVNLFIYYPSAIFFNFYFGLLEKLFESMGIEIIRCHHCLEVLLLQYIAVMVPCFLLYLLYDIYKGNINLSINKFTKSLSSNVNTILLTLLFLLHCIKQVCSTTLRKILLIFLLPITISILAGNPKYSWLSFHHDAPWDGYITPSKKLNPVGAELHKIINNQLLSIYKKTTLDNGVNTCESMFYNSNGLSDNEYSDCKIIGNLKEKFGDLTHYIIKEEWKSIKIPMPKSKEVHLSDFKNHVIGIDYYTPTIFIPRRYYLASKEINWLDGLNFIYYSIFYYLPTSKNAYFNDTIYLGLHEETEHLLDGKIFKIIKEIIQNPCSYMDEVYYYKRPSSNFSSNYYTVNSKVKDKFPILECRIPNNKRRYKKIQLYLYNKKAKVVKYINLERLD